MSVAIATYNGADYLEEQLRSLLSQTRPPDELVACDDSSTDQTMEQLRAFAHSAPFPVEILQNTPRAGPMATFERAIDSCSGDLIALSDQDDLWLPKKLEQVENVFLDSEATLVVVHDLAIVDSSLRPTGPTQIGRIDQLRMPRSTHVTGSATAFRSSIKPLLLPIPEIMRTYDAWIHAVGRALGARVVIDDVLSLYRRHATTNTKAITASWSLTGLIGAVRRTLAKPSDVVDGERAAWLAELERRIDSLSERDWKGLPKSDRTLADAFIRDQQEAIQERLEAISARWPRRWFRVANAYRKGLYEEFSGPGSAVRDLFTFRSRS